MSYLLDPRRIICLLLVCLGLSACTRLTDLHLAFEENEGGIIGTGIVGTITDIGSIYVNGVRVIYDDDLMVQTAFGDVSPKLLRPGDTVVVEAFPKSGALKATSIQRYRPITAAVQKVADDRSWLQALGVRVQIGETSTLLLDDQPVGWQAIDEGDWVTVDGIWRGDQVIASNVRLVQPRPLAAIRGVVGSGPDGSLQVGGVRIEGIKPANVKIDGVIAVKGKVEESADGTILLARKFAIPKFSPGIRRVIVEGFTSEPASNGAYTVYGSGLTSFADDPGEPMFTRRSLFCGTLHDVFDIETSIPLPVDGGRGDDVGDPDVLGRLIGSGCRG